MIVRAIRSTSERGTIVVQPILTDSSSPPATAASTLAVAQFSHRAASSIRRTGVPGPTLTILGIPTSGSQRLCGPSCLATSCWSTSLPWAIRASLRSSAIRARSRSALFTG